MADIELSQMIIELRKALECAQARKTVARACKIQPVKGLGDAGMNMLVGVLAVIPSGHNQLPLVPTAHEVGNAMRSLQSDEQMHMILDASHTLWKSIQASHGPSQILVQSHLPLGVDVPHSVLRAEDNVVM